MFNFLMNIYIFVEGHLRQKISQHIMASINYFYILSLCSNTQTRRPIEIGIVTLYTLVKLVKSELSCHIQ